MTQESANWTKKERLLFKRLHSPEKIQDFLNRMEYDPGYECRSPRWVIRERKATCFEGAIFASAALRVIRSLRKADKDLVRAGLLGAKKSGLYKPKK